MGKTKDKIEKETQNQSSEKVLLEQRETGFHKYELVYLLPDGTKEIQEITLSDDLSTPEEEAKRINTRNEILSELDKV